MEEIGTISISEIGVNLVVEWKIGKFSTLREHDAAFYHSPKFFFDGCEWFMWISPNGWKALGSSGYVDLSLHNGSGPKYSLKNTLVRQSFSLSLKTAKGKKCKKRHYTKDYYSNRAHDFIRFISRSELSRRMSDLVPDDVLTVVCTMKRSAFAGSYSKCFLNFLSSWIHMFQNNNFWLIEIVEVFEIKQSMIIIRIRWYGNT